MRPVCRQAPLLEGLFCYLATGGIIFVATCLPLRLPRQFTALVDAADFMSRFMGRNGWDYVLLLREGYSYQPHGASNIAFFPAYPLAARTLVWLTGTSVETALLVVSNGCLIGAFLLFGVYVRSRWPDGDSKLVDFTLLALALWPPTFFFRMMHSESLMLLTALAAMYMMQRRVHPFFVALVVGLATACRPVGVALLLPFALYLWQRRDRAGDRQGLAFLRNTLLLMPLACWGIGAFMVFQYAKFGEPLAFAKTQQQWSLTPGTSHVEQWVRAASLEPIVSVYDPVSPAYWKKQDKIDNPVFSLAFANPIYFVSMAVLVLVGWAKGWLDEREVLLAAFLILVPYVTHGYRYHMMCQGRYSAMAFPAYIVLGHLALRAPRWVVVIVAAVFTFFLATYSALFAAWYRLI